MEIEHKKLVSALICIVIFAVSVIAGFLNWELFILAGASILGYIYIDKKYLRCPHCGGFENLDRLFYAAKHEYHCRHCGKVLRIRK